MSQWIGSSLNRKLILGMAAGLIVVSAAFAALFVAIYRNQIEGERRDASVQINLLLQASLENAMLKRDLEGLRDIVAALGAQQDIRRVMIVTPEGEVRFSSAPKLLGERLAPPAAADTTAFTRGDDGHSVLRSVNVVHNQAPCVGCHGPLADNPVNGALLVDYDAEPIRDKALATALSLSGAGALVIVLTMLGAWWALRRFVLLPVARLERASQAFAEGRLETRVAVPGGDELARLGTSFNQMAARLQASWTTLRNHEAYLQGLIDTIPDGIRVIAEDFSVVMVNRAYCDQLGTTVAASVGTMCYRSSHQRQEPCCATMVTCPLIELRGGNQPIRCFHQHVRKDGGDLLVEVFAAPLVVERSGVSQRLVVESIRDLTKAVEYSHEQRLAELGQLAAGVAHEVHNPLASIRLSVQAMRRGVQRGQLDHADLDDYLTAADHEIQKCIEITERLLKLSTPPGTTPDMVDVNRAIAETMSILQHEAENLGIRIHLYLHPSGPRILTPESDLRMVLLNLAQNALHAMPDGGRLRVSSLAQCGNVQISFEDSGVGIKPEHVPHIYEPFFSHRADGARGTGLGLPICKAIVARHGGDIGLRTRVGDGTCFTITFPSAETRISTGELVAHETAEPIGWA